MDQATLVQVLLGVATVAAGIPAATAALKKKIDYIALSLCTAFASLLVRAL